MSYKTIRLLVSVVFSVASVAASGLAATPATGGITPKSRTVTWSGGPLNGSAPSRRNEACTPVNCDEFKLDINVPAKTFKAPAVPLVRLVLTTTAPNQFNLIVSPPGLNDAVGTNDYTVFGQKADLMSPKTGTWRIRAACYACANASYSVTASLIGYTPPPLEPQGTFKFFNATIPTGASGEPGIAVDPQGTVFINAPQGNGSVWRSSDKGKSWSDKLDLDVTPSGDSDLAIAPDDGTVYFMNLAYGPFSNNVYTSADHGQTYTGPSVAGVESDRQWFTAAPNGRVYVTYHDFGLPAAQMYVFRSDDHAKTFAKISSVALGASTMKETWCGNHEAGRPQVDPKDPNTYYIFYSITDLASCETANPAGADHALTQVWLAKSTDGGMTFTHTKVYESANGNTDHNLMGLDVDSAGNLYIVIAESNGRPTLNDAQVRKVTGKADDNGSVERNAATVAAQPGEIDASTHVKLFVSKDKGATWSKPLLVDQLKDHHSNVFAAVSAGDAGRVNIAWYTSRATSFLNEEATWTVAMAQSTNALSAKPIFKQTRVSGLVHKGAICQAGLGCTVSGADRNLADFLAIDTGPDGMAHVVWSNTTTGAVQIQYGRQTAGVNMKAPRAKKH